MVTTLFQHCNAVCNSRAAQLGFTIKMILSHVILLNKLLTISDFILALYVVSKSGKNLKHRISQNNPKRWLACIMLSQVYSYFEKGCRKKCTGQSRKVLWVVLSSLFFQRNLKEWYERPWTYVHGQNHARITAYRIYKRSTVQKITKKKKRNSVLLISRTTFRDYRVHIFPTTFLEIAVYRKIPKISPGAFIFQRPFFKGLIFGGAYIRKGLSGPAL